jgi:hypothetical protein
VKVNERTKRYGEQITDKAEQADDPQLKNEFKDLSDRQIKIEEISRDIATGKNK